MTVEPPETSPTIPAGFVAYRRTPVFTRETVPAGLLRAHTTKAGTWGLLHVLEGQLLFRVHEPASETLLEPGRPPGVIPSQAPHEVAPQGDGPLRFCIEFFHSRTEDAGSVR